MKNDLKCPDCGKEMILRTSTKHEYRSAGKKKFYACIGFPVCFNTVSADPNGVVAGIPADKQTRMWRGKLHSLCAKIWNFDKISERGKMYEYIQSHMGKGHIAEMDKDELRRLQQLIKKDFTYKLI